MKDWIHGGSLAHLSLIFEGLFQLKSRCFDSFPVIVLVLSFVLSVPVCCGCYSTKWYMNHGVAPARDKGHSENVHEYSGLFVLIRLLRSRVEVRAGADPVDGWVGGGVQPGPVTTASQGYNT